jgi:hypothetical protein
VQESHYELLGQLWGEMTAPLQDGKGDVIIASGNFQQALNDGSTNQHPLVQSAIGNMTGAVRILDGEDGSASAVNSLLQPENAEAITELAAHLRAAGEIAIRLAGITTGAEDEVEQAQLQIYEGVSAADKYIETVL